MSELIFPTCDVCGHKLHEGMAAYAFSDGEYVFCEKCVKKEFKKLSPYLRDVIEDYFYDYRTDARYLIGEQEE